MNVMTEMRAAVSSRSEMLVDFSSQGIPIFRAAYAQDISDLSALRQIREKEAALMALPSAKRNAAFKAQSPILADFCRNEASFRALEQIYTRDGVRFHGLEDVDDGGEARNWFECYSNARAARERGSVTTELVRQAITDRLPSSNGVEMISIASGSGRCVMQAVQSVQPAPVSVCLLDWDEGALAYSRQLAQAAGISTMVETVRGNVIKIDRHLSARRAHVVEAVGILDYLDAASVCFLLDQIRALLLPGGVVIASNIMPNRESAFLHSVVGWRRMHYRNENTFARLFLQAGFQLQNTAVYRLPIGIHCVVSATA